MELIIWASWGDASIHGDLCSGGSVIKMSVGCGETKLSLEYQDKGVLVKKRISTSHAACFLDFLTCISAYIPASAAHLLCRYLTFPDSRAQTVRITRAAELARRSGAVAGNARGAAKI